MKRENIALLVKQLLDNATYVLTPNEDLGTILHETLGLDILGNNTEKTIVMRLNQGKQDFKIFHIFFQACTGLLTNV